MVTISKLKLNQLGRAELEARQMNALRGGVIPSGVCTCSCYYENSGGSSTSGNTSANSEHGYSSTSGCNQYMKAGDHDPLYCSDCKEGDTGSGWKSY